MKNIVLPLLTFVLFYQVGVKLNNWYKAPNYTFPNSDAEFAAVTVSITNLAGTSGGSGSIISSSEAESTVLTNAHVCGVAKRGGKVNTDNDSALVVSYKVSLQHDLCLISVKRNLHKNTRIATKPPVMYSASHVTGHPSLYPTIITHGQFSGRRVITVPTGFRPCEKADWNGPNAGMCFFLGGVPVVRMYESQFVSNLISPGSSGSAVFNDEGEIAGVAFAGKGPLNHGLIVPWEYVRSFFDDEVEFLPSQYPKMTVDPDLEERATEKLTEVCKQGYSNPDYKLVEELCEYEEEFKL